MPDDFRNVHQAEEFLKDRYGVTFYGLYGDDDGDIHIKRYGEAEIVEGRYTVPIYNLAPYMSGKETFQYFFDRGFTRDTVRSFKIGRDINHMTVTIPVFWEDGVLAGIIGRYAVPRPKNSRYKIYAFPKGNMLFPLDHFIAPSDGGIILVEGTFDALRMYQNGFTNTLATLTDSMSDAQAKWIKDHAQYVIDMFDNDRGGLNARETARKQLQGMPYYTVEYPEGKKDPCDCTMSEIHTMIDNKMGLLKRPLRRL
jgi:DNA primase